MAEKKKTQLRGKPHTRTAVGVTLPLMPKIRRPGKALASTEELAAAYTKETDSPYVCLSKQGGHKDLLKIELPVIADKPQPVAYPRNKWYYYLDNAKEDAVKNTTNFQSGEYGFPKNSTLQDSLNNKWKQMHSNNDLLKVDMYVYVKEPKTVSYPRNEWYYYSDNANEDALKKTNYNYQHHHDMPQQGRGFSQTSQGVNIPTYGQRKEIPEKPLFSMPKITNINNSANPRVYGTMAAEESSGQMNKIMAHSYQQEWQDQSRVYRQQVQARLTKSLEPRSEYRRKYGPAVQVWQRAVDRHAAVKSKYRLPANKPGQNPDLPSLPDRSKAAVGGKQQGERFMLSRFKKIGPKVDTGRKNIH